LPTFHRHPEKAPPLVSVIVATLDRPEMLNGCLRSIFEQTYDHFEIIVVNDGGTDVGDVVHCWNTRNNIIYLRHPRTKGVAAARNSGIQAAGGEYIAYVDDDDRYYPEHLETLVKSLETSDAQVAYSDAIRAHQKFVNGKYLTYRIDAPYSLDFDPDRILVRNFIPTLCILHRSDCLEKTGLFDESLQVLEDWDLWIRMSRHFRFVHIRKATCEYSWRAGGGSLTSRRGRKAFYRTVGDIYGKYRALALANPRVAAGQRNYLRNAKMLLRLSTLLGERSRAFQSILAILEKVYL